MVQPVFDNSAAAANGRDCGECNLCCTLVGVKSLGKLPGKSCIHQCASGCGIYGKHPHDCKEWSCVWRVGELDTKDRPDKLGAIFDLSNLNESGSIVCFLDRGQPEPNAAVRHAAAKLIAVFDCQIKYLPFQSRYPPFARTLANPECDQAKLIELPLAQKSRRNIKYRSRPLGPREELFVYTEMLPI